MDPRSDAKTMVTFRDSCMQMAVVVEEMFSTHGIPHAVGLDIVRMTMMFVVSEDTEKVTDALVPPPAQEHRNS